MGEARVAAHDRQHCRALADRPGPGVGPMTPDSVPTTERHSPPGSAADQPPLRGGRAFGWTSGKKHGNARPARDVIRAKTGPDTPERIIHVAHIFGCQDGPDGPFCPTHSPEGLGDEPMRYFTIGTASP